MANQHIHTGFWVDHSQGPVLGATLTFSAQWGSQLVSAAAIVVQIVGVALWTIIAFGLHQYRASPRLRDEPDRQLQVLLRNTEGPDWAVWNLGSLYKQWRSEKRPGAFTKAVPFQTVAAAIYVGFLVAGIFVGFITLNQFGNSIVLLKPGACGSVGKHHTTQSSNGLQHININVSTAAMQYARSCYGTGSSGAISCSVYPVPTLDYTIALDQPCPIPGGSACFQGEDAQPMTLTTKVLDSHTDLGINAPAKDRVTLQYRTTCAPLAYDFVDSITKEVNETSSNVTVLQFHAGTLEQLTFSNDFTFEYAPLIRYWGINVIGYAVNAYQSWYPNTGAPGGWAPAAPFNETKSDLSLFFLTTNGVTFSSPVSDPMFRTFNTPSPAVLGPDRYVPERDVYMLACTEEREFCNPTNNACTGWASTTGIVYEFDEWTNKLSLNAAQNASFYRMALLASDSSMYSAVDGVASSLLASSYLNTPTGSQPLPDGHWRSEVEGWFQAVLAKIQYYQTVYVNLPLDVVAANNIEVVPPDTEAGLAQCSQQRVTSPQGYQSYSFFGVILIAFFGVLVPAVSFALKRWHHVVRGWERHGHKARSYEREELWELYKRGTLHMSSDDESEDETTQRNGQVAGLKPAARGANDGADNGAGSSQASEKATP